MFAQSDIAGTVVNTTNSPIPFAGVIVKSGTFEKNIQSDSTGKFTFNKLENGTYLLHISHVGYNTYEYNFYLHQDTNFIVVLQPSGEQLSEVVVTGNKPLIEKTADKIVYHVANSITAAGGDVLQAINQLPGVKTNNNEISITGKGLVRVMINNRLLPLQGEDLTHYLKSLSANEISRIELLNNPPAKYEVEGNAGLINIITRHSKSQGYSGNVQLASKYYVPGVSSMYGVHSFGEINASANVAYNDNKWSFFGSVNHVRDRHLEGFETDVFYPQQSWLQTDTGLYTHNAYSVIAGVDYKLNAAAIIGASYSGGRDVYDGSDHVRNLTYSRSGTLDSVLRTYAHYHPVALPASFNLHADIKLDTTGRQLSINADYLNYYRNDVSDFESNRYDGDDKYIPGSTTRYFDRNKQNILVYTLKADADWPTSFAKFSFGTKLSFITNYSNAFYYDKTSSGDLIYNTNLSNEFDYRENTQAVYGSVSKDMNKWKTQAGLRMEFTQTKGYSYTVQQTTVNQYLRFFPSILISYAANRDNTYSLSAGRRINRPSFWNLNPFKSLFTAYSYGEGNPYLQPEYNSNAELSHVYKNILTTTLFANKTDDGFMNVTVANTDTNLVYTKPINFIQTFRVGIAENISFKPFNWWESNGLFSFYHTNAQSAFSNISDIKGFGAYLSSSNNLYLNQSKTFAAAINFWYQFPEVDHTGRSDRYFKLDIGFKTTGNNKKWDIILNLNDAFRSSASAVSYMVNGIPQKFTNFQINRYFQLSINYRFGRNTGSSINRSTGNEEEKGRIH